MRRLEKRTAVLVFHINKDHSEVSWDTYQKMTEQGEFLKMLQTIKIPVELSIQGEDVDFLWETSPAIVEEMRSNPKIGILSGIYTHMMPTCFPGLLSEQLAIGKKILENYFNEKLSWVGCLPEADIDTHVVPLLKKAGWDGVIALKDAHYTYEYRKEKNTRIPLVRKTILGLKQMSLIMAEGEELRSVYLNFYRGFATAEEFLRTLESKIASNKLNFAVFLIDFEVPQVNAINGKSRIDLWMEFFEALSNSSIEFRHFKDTEIQQFIQETARQGPEAEIERQPMPKWHHSTDVYKSIEKAFDNSSIHRYNLFRLTISDTFSALYWREVSKKTQIELPVKNSNTKVIIKPDLERRIKAFNYFLQTPERTLSSLDEPVLKWYLGTLEKIHKRLF